MLVMGTNTSAAFLADLLSKFHLFICVKLYAVFAIFVINLTLISRNMTIYFFQNGFEKLIIGRTCLNVERFLKSFKI